MQPNALLEVVATSPYLMIELYPTPVSPKTMMFGNRRIEKSKAWDGFLSMVGMLGRRSFGTCVWGAGV